MRLRKVLVANRGEIALRIVRTLREMDIRSVAVYSDADRYAIHVSEADEAYRVGPPPAQDSYLNAEELIRVAVASGSDAIHPGYGFLAENAEFAQAVVDAELIFVGPSSEAIARMGNKIQARATAVRAGIPVVPGTEGAVKTAEEANRFVEQHGLPVLVKAGGGGGGRGIRVVDSVEQLPEALERASKEANTYFHDPEVYLERYFAEARHIEVQVAGDSSGVVVAWGERDCSTQRRRQKLIEETPAAGISPEDRRHLLDAAIKCATTIGYVGIGTVEFLYVGPSQFYFLEMNTRIQVEHPVTEQTSGRDLVRESLVLAAGGSATVDITPRGHSIEARINAEDPARGFAPGPGLISRYREPGGPGVRVDSGVYQGFNMPANYDSLMAKVIATDVNRERARLRLLRALAEFQIEGVPTTIPLVRNILESQPFIAGTLTTDWLDAHLSEVVGPAQSPASIAKVPDEKEQIMGVEVNGKRFNVRIFDSGASNVPRRSKAREKRTSKRVHSAGDIVSPMHGTIMAVNKKAGESVEPGETVFVIEAMKMENEVAAPRAGTIKAVVVELGQTVEVDQVLAELDREE